MRAVIEVIGIRTIILSLSISQVCELVLLIALFMLRSRFQYISVVTA